MPGLIDSHVHLGFDGGPNPAARMRSETDEQQLVLMLHSARDLLGVGVTTARDLGARAYLDVVVRDAIAAGLARGPRMVVATRPITVTGGHCWFMGGEADSDDELRRMVRTHHKHGADLIKVMSTGGFMTTGSAPWYAQFTQAQLAVIVEEAGRVDKPVAAHAHGIEGIRRAVEAGVTTLEHCSFVTETNERRFDEPLAARIADRRIFVCPTINVNAPYVAELTGIVVGEHLIAMHEMGVRLIAGTDAGIDNTPHHQYVGGLEYLVTLGFRAAEVLAMATTEAAAALGVDTITGRLAPGFDADVIVVDGDPSTDIAALGQAAARHRSRPRLPARQRPLRCQRTRDAIRVPRSRHRPQVAHRGDQATAGLDGAAAAVDDVLQLLPVDIDAFEAGQPQVLQLRAERDYVAHVVIPAGLFQRRAMHPLGRRPGVVVVAHSLPGGFDHGICRASPDRS